VKKQKTHWALKKLALVLLEDLDAGWLEVRKVPNGHGGYVRVPVSVNAAWYRHFCSRHLTTQRRYPKPRTLIRRQHTRAALKRIGRGDSRGVYADRLVRFMHDWKVPKRRRKRESNPIPF
jgi:hypothetical protein